MKVGIFLLSFSFLCTHCWPRVVDYHLFPFPKEFAMV
jgi:hypothetical protein